MIVTQAHRLTKDEKLRKEGEILPYYAHLIVLYNKPDYSAGLGRRNAYSPMVEWLLETGIRPGYDFTFGDIDFRQKCYGIFGFAKEEHAVAFKVRWVGADV
jgi:hypothetical protein